VKKYKWTLTGCLLALILWGGIAWQNIDVFDFVAAFLQRFERYELNEIFLPILVFYTFAMADLFRRHEALRVETEKLKLYRKMIKAVYHIMNNFLQKMMVFKLAAEEAPEFDPDVLKSYDQMIRETDEQIQLLGSLEKPDEELIEKIITPDTESNASSPRQ